MINMTRKTPNAEQEAAIFHHGGKLLSAGAGSGKTFVLIEHLIFLLRNIQKKYPQSDWNKRISSDIAKIVLMTFTKKAAGEMSVRMMKRVEELIEDTVSEEKADEHLFWILVRQNLSFLNITTIHGFCHRLLSLGFSNKVPQEINLVSSIEHKNKIQKLFDKWFNENQKKLDPVFLASSFALESAMVDIFSTPELRVLWDNPRIPESAEKEIDLFFAEYLETKSYKSLFEEMIDLSASDKAQKQKWYDLLIQFNELKDQQGFISFKNFSHYNDFFKALGSFPTSTSKEISILQKESLRLIKEFRDDIKDLVVDLEAIISDFETYKKWVNTIAELFSFLETHYFEVDGFSFSDLEYYVLQILKDELALKKIQESFSYFIVDEFQDTSFIQFEILKKLIGEKNEKLFCVGDKKQAIYGFRGGELQVFTECAKLLGETNNYFLKNNFRSNKSIIEFNNDLFEQVFPLGINFKGHDAHSVQMESQLVPNTNAQVGEVLSLRTQVMGEGELDLDSLEAEILGEHIKELINQDEYSSICVLYRKLKPSALLLDYFLKNNIAFNAQIKIQFEDDPLINLFLYLVELKLNEQDQKKKKSGLILINTLLKILGVSYYEVQVLDQFFADIKLLGLRLAFHKFIFTIGLSNSFYAQNAEVIDAICRITNEDVIKVYNMLKHDGGEAYACDMMSGQEKKRVTIMTAHASKGLEFDAVVLGGIHTNGRYNGMKEHIGNFPHSFKWKKSFDQKKFHKSPFYHLEAEILKLKDFSESKRLLYVACTRAVKQLSFVDLWSVVKGENKDLYSNENSWIQAMRLNPAKMKDGVVLKSDSKNVEVALIQRDSLGMKALDNNLALGLVPELSVTRLATIADCPFKFYLQNICKIEVDGIGSSLKSSEDESFEETSALPFYSSKKRGVEIHSYLSKLFLGEITQDKLPLKEKEKILWAFDLGKMDQKNLEIISERMIKFSFFGQMISGTPDLLFVSDESLVVWDFKTGIRDTKNEESYWFQLMCYGYAYGKLKHFNPDKKIELTLLYLDQKEKVSQKFSLNEITQTLFAFWKKTSSLNQINLLHCSNCEYSSICQKGKSSIVN